MTQTKKHWTWEEHELSTGYSAVVYDPDGIAVDTHIAAKKAEHIANCMNACAGLNPAAIPDVVAALESARDILAHSGAENGTCMCGELRGSHDESSGHSFVDSHTYHAGEQVASIDKALAKLQVQS